MNKFHELQDLIKSYEQDFNKFYFKCNRTAGVRLRKKMQELRAFAKNIRNEIQELNKRRSEED